MRRLILLLLLAIPVQGFSEGKSVAIENPWSRATPPGANIAAGYMTIENKSASADRLVGASSPLAAKVETHVTMRDGDIMKMREVKGYEVPAKGRFELKPGGAHLMLVGIKHPFKDGDKVPLVLRFEKAGEVKVEMPVRSAAPAAGHMDMNHMDMKR
jgi:copper(I)-binding protein